MPNRMDFGTVGGDFRYGCLNPSCQNHMSLSSTTLLVGLVTFEPSGLGLFLLSVTVRLTHPEVKIQKSRMMQ